MGRVFHEKGFLNLARKSPIWELKLKSSVNICFTGNHDKIMKNVDRRSGSQRQERRVERMIYLSFS